MTMRGRRDVGGGGRGYYTVRDGRGARVRPALPARMSMNNGKEDGDVAGGRRPATDEAQGGTT